MSLEIEALLQPIPGDNPAGEWLRYEATYDRIQDARREDDETLPQGVWQKKAKRADWKAVASLCQDALRTRTKDLQIAAYLTEAWMRLHGPRGAAAGVRLLGELASRFWEVAYPLLDGEDCSYRLAPFEWLEGRLPVLLRLWPLATVTAAAGGASGGATTTVQRPVCFADWERAVRPGQAAAASSGSEGSEPEVWTQDKLAAALDRVEGSTLRDAAEQLSGLLQTTERTAQILDARVGKSTGALSKVSELVSRILGFLKPWASAGDAVDTGKESVVGAPSGPGGEREGGAANPSQRAGGRISSRADAYRALDEIADYLLRTEPHSPTGYLVKRAVRWGELPLQQLLTELVPDERGLTAIYTLLGLGKRGETKSSS